MRIEALSYFRPNNGLATYLQNNTFMNYRANRGATAGTHIVTLATDEISIFLRFDWKIFTLLFEQFQSAFRLFYY